MDRYIEVIGEGTFEEAASLFVTHVTLEVRAAKPETALQEAQDLWKRAVESLGASGIAADEIVEGGSDQSRPWYRRKKAGQTASRALILKVPECPRLQAALESLQSVKENTRESIEVSLRQPEFDSSSSARESALTQAFEDAHGKAAALARRMGVELGEVLQAQEGGWAKRSSGFQGDPDWWGDSERFSAPAAYAVAAGEAEPTPDLASPTRLIWVKCRFRFAVN